MNHHSYMPVSLAEEIAMIDAAMVEMTNISPPLKRSECQRLILAALSASDAQKAALRNHPDDYAVDIFAAAMKSKLAAARAKGRGGWETAECTQERLSTMLREHVEKGDPRDVANFCAFLWSRGESILKSPARPQADTAAAPKGAEQVGEDGWPKLVKPARNGAGLFGRGVSARLLVESCYRRAELETAMMHPTPGQEYEQEMARRRFWDMAHGAAPQTPAAAVAPAGAESVADSIAATVCRQVADLPDRDSPEDWPEAMLVTADELRMIVRQALGAAGPVTEAGGAARLTEAELLEVQRAVDDFEDCGETDVAYALLLRAAVAGYLECTHFQVRQEGGAGR